MKGNACGLITHHDLMCREQDGFLGLSWRTDSNTEKAFWFLRLLAFPKEIFRQFFLPGLSQREAVQGQNLD